MNNLELIDQLSNISKDILKEEYGFVSLDIKMIKHSHIDLTTTKINGTVFLKDSKGHISYEADSCDELLTVLKIKLNNKINQQKPIELIK